jgi:hypothetical protein
MLWLMLGCTSQQKVYEATYSDGCYFNIKKMSSEQAADMQQKWDFKGCEVREQDEDSK